MATHHHGTVTNPLARSVIHNATESTDSPTRSYVPEHSVEERNAEYWAKRNEELRRWQISDQRRQFTEASEQREWEIRFMQYGSLGLCAAVAFGMIIGSIQYANNQGRAQMATAASTQDRGRTGQHIQPAGVAVLKRPDDSTQRDNRPNARASDPVRVP